MSTTVREALANAQHNLDTACRFGPHNPLAIMAKSQLDHALQAIDNGMQLDDVLQESLSGDVITSKEQL